jgi:hypothetical protein
LFAGTQGGGIFKTINGGGSWAPANTGLTATFVDALAINPMTPATVYAGTNGGGVFVSTNGGDSWTAVNIGLTSPNVTALAIDPATPAILYAGTNGGGVFKSINGGDSWTAVNLGLKSLSVQTLAVDPIRPSTLYAGTDGAGVFQSLDGGGSWNAMNGGLSNMRIYALAIDSIGRTLHAGSYGNGEYDYSVIKTSFYTLPPCRVADTRNPDSPSGGPALSAKTTRDFPIAGLCGIPPSAGAIAINIAVFQPSNGGDLRIFPTGGAAPLASAINFRPGIVRANNAVISLGSGGQISVQCDMLSGSTNLFLDVYGYFE